MYGDADIRVHTCIVLLICPGEEETRLVVTTGVSYGGGCVVSACAFVKF